MRIRRVGVHIASILMALGMAVGLLDLPSARAAPSAPNTANTANAANAANAVTGAQAMISKTTLSDTSVDGPALWTTTNGTIRGALAWTGTDAGHHLNVMLTSTGMAFSSKVTLDETSPVRPAVTRTQFSASVLCLPR